MSVYVRTTWNTFVGVSTCADGLISVIVIAVWLRVMTQVVFRAAGVARIILLLFRACPRIWFRMCIRIFYVPCLVYWGRNFWGTLVCGSLCVPDFSR